MSLVPHTQNPPEALPVPAMAQEAAQAAEAAREQLRRCAPAFAELGARLRQSPPRFVVTCARGSSDHAASYGKYLVETTLGRAVASVGPSVASVYHTPHLDLRDSLFVAVSQSGKSPDLLRLTERARAAGLQVTIATVRVQKPGEEGYDTRLDRLRPDAVLVRHWGALMHFLERPAQGERPALHGDFSLNVTNSITAAHLLGLGLDTLTVSHDLDEAQLFALLAHAPAHRLTVALHHHIATFHPVW